MPLKNIWNRAPLLPLQQCPLSNGQIRVSDEDLNRLYAFCLGYADATEIWEGAFALSCMLTDAPLEEPFADRIRNAVFETAEGAFSGDIPHQIAVARAGLALYEYTVDREILKRLASWCGAMELGWDSVEAAWEVRTSAADLMEFLVRLYRISGIRAIPRLCARLRSLSVDWSMILNTFNQKQTLSAQMTREELLKHLEEDKKDETAFYTRQYLISCAETLADGLRFAARSAEYSGNGQELGAGEKGWELVRKAHGSPCGGTTSDDLLAGKSSAKAMSTAALAAWCEAFCAYIPLSRSTWASDEVQLLVINALRAAIREHEILRYQRVNMPVENGDSTRCFFPDENGDAPTHAVARLARAFAAAYKNSVMPTQRGFSVNMALNGCFVLKMAGHPFILHIRDGQIGFGIREPFHGVAMINANRWSDDFRISLNGEITYHVSPGTRNLIERDWHDKDILNIFDAGDPVLCEDHRHGVYCMRGSTVMALPVTKDDWAWAVCGDPVWKNDRVLLPVKKVRTWKAVGAIPSDVPVYPEGEGTAEMKELQPYARTAGRITVFPKVRTE